MTSEINDEIKHAKNEIFWIEVPTTNEPSEISVKEKSNEEKKDGLYFTIKICKLKLRILKSLIPLKIMFFLFYGGTTYMPSFLVVYFKHRGITLTELSAALIATSFAQVTGSTLFGIISDKLGKPKQLLLLNLGTVTLLIGCVLLTPKVNYESCYAELHNASCHHDQLQIVIGGKNSSTIEVKSCNFQCSEHLSNFCNNTNADCDKLSNQGSFENITLVAKMNEEISRKQDLCFYNVSDLFNNNNSSFNWCNTTNVASCRISCFIVNNCKKYHSTPLVVANMTLFVLFLVFSNTAYRFFDVVGMILVSKYHADYGQQRLFGLVGMIAVPPIAGWLIDATTHDSNEKNYDATFYFYMALIILLIFISYNIEDVKLKPAQKMKKQTLKLLKNPDIVFFAILLCILGSAYFFKKFYLFWHLEELKSSSLLLGLVSAVGSLYGLPFFATSGWWIRKLGTNKILVISLLCHAVSCVGYSLIENPWFAILLETSKIFTYHLLWVAVVTKSHAIAPEGMLSTVIVTAGVIHFQLGKLSGSIFGETVVRHFGIRAAFRAVAGTCTVTAAAYVFYLYVRRKFFSKDVSRQEH